LLNKNIRSQIPHSVIFTQGIFVVTALVELMLLQNKFGPVHVNINQEYRQKLDSARYSEKNVTRYSGIEKTALLYIFQHIIYDL